MISPAALFAKMPVPIVFIDAAGASAFANDRGYAVLGLPAGGADYSVILTAMAPILTDLADAPSRTVDFTGEVSVGGHRYRVEASSVEDDGRAGRMWLFHDPAPDRDADFPALIKTALDELDEGFMLVDPDDCIRLWNTAFFEMLDLPGHMFEKGAGVMRLIRTLADRGDYGPGDPAQLAEVIAGNIRSRKPAKGERQMTNGSIIAVEWLPLAHGYFLFRMQNVTHERTASRFKDELIATVSHELRTPLTVISGALGLLRGGIGGPTEAQADELIDIAYKNSDRLTRLVNDLLDIDKLQSGTLDFLFEPIELGPLLAASVSQNMPYATGLGIEVVLELPDEPVVAEVDRDRMMQVMSNLLSNASKFSTTGSQVRVQLRASASGVRISVIDKGRGMSPDFCRRLFTRFAQENRASERGQAGTGLGLAICKSIVDRHGGQIHADSQEGVGTIFHIDLPYHQAPIQAQA